MASVIAESRETPFGNKLEALQSTIVGRVITKENIHYEFKRKQYWNKICQELEPLCFIEAHCESDVISTVVFCEVEKLPLCVRSGGNGDRSIATAAVVLDLAEMKSIEIDASNKLLATEPGALTGSIDIQTTKHGLAVTFGTASIIGVGGQALELGLGFLGRKFGYLIDNVLQYDLILASGEKLTVTRQSHPDLFWALKGLGANFGVVTKYAIRLYPIPVMMFGGCCFFAWTDAKKAIQHGRDFQQHFAGIRDLNLFMMLHVSNQGHQVFYRFLFTGEPAEGKEIIDCLLSNCPVKCLYNTVELLPYDTFQRSCDNVYQHGMYYYVHPGHFLPGLTDDYIDNTLRTFSTLQPGEHTYSNAYFQPLGGAIADIAEDSSPFLHRQARYWAGIVGAGKNKECYSKMSELINQWDSTNSNNAMRSDKDKEKEVICRLKELKKKYDPGNVFRFSACNINP